MSPSIQIYIKRFQGMVEAGDNVKLLHSKTSTRAFPEGIIITAQKPYYDGSEYSKLLTIYFIKRNIPLDQISEDRRSWITNSCIMRMFFNKDEGWRFHLSGNLDELYYDNLNSIKEFCKNYLKNYCYNNQ